MYLNIDKKLLLNKSHRSSSRMAIPSPSPSLMRLQLQEHDNFSMSHVELKSICPCGGRCPRCKAPNKTGQIPLIQTKLKVSQPDDLLEREADKIAEQVVGMNYVQNDTKFVHQDKAKETTNWECSECEEENNDDQDKPIQINRKSNLNEKENPQVSNEINNRIINNLSGGGKPLDTQTQEFMETRFGYDFSGIRIYNDSKSDELAGSLNADAFTFGNNIFLSKHESIANTENTRGFSLLREHLYHTELPVQYKYRE